MKSPSRSRSKASGFKGIHHVASALRCLRDGTFVLLLLWLTSCERSHSCSFSVVNHEPHSSLAQRVESNILRHSSAQAEAAGSAVQIQLVTVQVEPSAGGEDGWRVFHVITDARNRYLTAGTCGSGAENCSARIIESAKRECASIPGGKQSSTPNKMDARDAADASLIKVYAEAINGMAGARQKPSNGPNCSPYVVDARTVATRGGLVPSQGGAYFVLMGSDKTLEYAGTCGGTPFECAQQVGRRMDEFCPGAP